VRKTSNRSLKMDSDEVELGAISPNPTDSRIVLQSNLDDCLSRLITVGSWVASHTRDIHVSFHFHHRLVSRVETSSDSLRNQIQQPTQTSDQVD